MIALFMLLIDMHEERQTRRLKFAGGICFGLLTLVRVTNAVMIFLFVFYGVNFCEEIRAKNRRTG